jgi:hypothetical protein
MNAITAPPSREVVIPTWQYGWGAYDPAAKRVDFHPLPTFSKGNWQGSDKMPDKTLAFVSVNSEGGHPGRDAAHAAIRRWTADADGFINVSGLIERPAKEGDGVVAQVVSSRTGPLFKAAVGPAGQADAKLDHLEVKKGDTLDFIVDCGAADTSDGFKWHPIIHAEHGEWDAKAQFAGPAPKGPAQLKPWEQYAQVLLETNEFIFVD